MRLDRRLDRRQFLQVSGGLGFYALMSTSVRTSARGGPLSQYFADLLQKQHVPGVALAIVGPGGKAWSEGYGYANLESGVEMSPVHTVLNIGSVSKTVTATAVLQLCEQGRLSLTQDVDTILPFSLRNPFHPTTPITTWQLLVHRSSIKDGPGYARSYGCGPSGLVLGEWLKSYLCASGDRFEADANFHTWKPGQGVIPAKPRSYSNVGFGVLGYLVELVSGMPFPLYCDDHIFAPLGMHDTHWRLADVPAGRHAVPYSFVDAGFTTLPEGWSPSDMLPASPVPPDWPPPPGSQFPHCAYEFATYPDGGLRTTAEDLGRFLTSYVNGGRFGQARILNEVTVKEILADQRLEGNPGQGLGWSTLRAGSGRVLWGHGGSDPGVRAAMYIDPVLRIGIVILSNTSQDVIKGALDHVYQYCLDHRWPSVVWE